MTILRSYIAIPTLFEGYQDPVRARKVFLQYFQDIRELSLVNSAEKIILGCTNSDQLDTRLDTLVTHVRILNKCENDSYEPDFDFIGSSSNALRILEEDR